ncbi:MAG: hypothetical protein J7539_10800 [Niabella sp.]|nr:hypothetical protein [Niabella sp.]
MGRNQTSWTSATVPKGRGSAKNNKTKILEAIGLDGWASLETFLKNEGALLLVEKIRQLKPKDYVVCYDRLSEFIKPKLSRQTIVGEKDAPINISIIKSYDDGNKAE